MKTVNYPWICPTCRRSRRTNFCPDCGSSASPKEDVDSSLGKLKAMHSTERATQVAAFNTASSYMAKVENGEPCSEFGCSHEHMAESHLKRSEAARERADALEWAIEQIEAGGA